ncbi:hypothetical protein L195_g042861 [Trifolium pratense]|uniref:Uncharacterized protein n=1 Tax=Trifolium pratense TaxID=57577 RepID=A0A2K3M7Q0_TRIPR|nr:hypothetical protein L195_g042861 [Trifolium pratense]
MSMESGNGVARKKSDLKPEPEPKRLKSEAGLRSEQEQEPKPPYYDFDPISIFDGNF